MSNGDQHIDKLKELIEASKDFDDTEVRLLKKFIEAYRGWIVVGRFGKLILTFLTAIAAGVAAWDSTVQTIKSWIS